MLGRDGGGLEALAVVAALLDMADRRAEERGAVLLRDGEQRDLAVEGDELLDDEFADVAAAAAAPVFPGVFQFVGGAHQRLPFARGGHQRLDDARETDPRGGGFQLVERPGVKVLCGFQPQLFGGQVADRLAVHREVDCTRARHDLDAPLLAGVEPFGTDRLDFGNDDVWIMLRHDGFQSVAVEHVEDLAGVGHLHGRCACIRVAGHHVLSQPLGGDHELLAQFSGAQ